MKPIKYVLVSLSLLLFSQVVAAYPTSVVGNWAVRANQTPGNMNITFQSTAAGPCKLIQGNIFGSPITGFYCPNTGRIQFLRKDAANNDTIQVYSANLTSAGSIQYMGGSFGSFDAGFGEYSFFASK